MVKEAEYSFAISATTVKKVSFGCFLVLTLFYTTAAAYEIGFNVHGFSYHPDRTDSTGRRFKEFNPGIGVRFAVAESRRHVWLSETGFYRNSSGHISKYFGGGYRLKLFAGFQIGPSIVLYQSPDQNSGKVFAAPLAVLSYQYRRVLFNVVPVPRYKDVNRNAAIGFYLTVNVFKL